MASQKRKRPQAANLDETQTTSPHHEEPQEVAQGFVTFSAVEALGYTEPIYFCQAATCPGYHFRAAEVERNDGSRPHPVGTCGSIVNVLHSGEGRRHPETGFNSVMLAQEKNPVLVPVPSLDDPEETAQQSATPEASGELPSLPEPTAVLLKASTETEAAPLDVDQYLPSAAEPMQPAQQDETTASGHHPDTERPPAPNIPEEVELGSVWTTGDSWWGVVIDIAPRKARLAMVPDEGEPVFFQDWDMPQAIHAGHLRRCSLDPALLAALIRGARRFGEQHGQRTSEHVDRVLREIALELAVEPVTVERVFIGIAEAVRTFVSSSELLSTSPFVSALLARVKSPRAAKMLEVVSQSLLSGPIHSMVTSELAALGATIAPHVPEEAPRSEPAEGLSGLSEDLLEQNSTLVSQLTRDMNDLREDLADLHVEVEQLAKSIRERDKLAEKRAKDNAAKKRKREKLIRDTGSSYTPQIAANEKSKRESAARAKKEAADALGTTVHKLGKKRGRKPTSAAAAGEKRGRGRPPGTGKNQRAAAAAAGQAKAPKPPAPKPPNTARPIAGATSTPASLEDIKAWMGPSTKQHPAIRAMLMKLNQKVWEKFKKQATRGVPDLHALCPTWTAEEQSSFARWYYAGRRT